MPQQFPAQAMLSSIMGAGTGAGTQGANWPWFGGPQTTPAWGTPEYVPGGTPRSGSPQMGAPAQGIPGTPQAPNPQYPGTQGNFTGQQPVATPSTQPDMNSVMNGVISGAAQNLGGAQGQPQIHPAIQQFQGMLQGLQANPQMAQAVFGSMPGGIQGFVNMLQPLLGNMPQTPGQASSSQGQSKGNLSQGALAMLKNLSGNTAGAGKNLIQMR